ncbi:hypothetical protein [Clostridium butyricum]|uniref:hypothetical protein n=1 Tax=Clostridium butyricum TaxID=1492 RepID=UPI002ABD2F25|nr:hypothetical protein [Clostridium butyricum]
MNNSINKKDILKAHINILTSKYIDDLEKLGELNFFEINIKHINGELISSKHTTNKMKLKDMEINKKI